MWKAASQGQAVNKRTKSILQKILSPELKVIRTVHIWTLLNNASSKAPPHVTLSDKGTTRLWPQWKHFWQKQAAASNAVDGSLFWGFLEKQANTGLSFQHATRTHRELEPTGNSNCDGSGFWRERLHKPGHHWRQHPHIKWPFVLA